MANPVNLAGTMPGEAVNGLFTAAKELLADPKILRLAVVVLDVDTIKTKVATGEDTPVVQLRHIELVSAARADAARGLLLAELRDRTGQEQLELSFNPGSVAPPPPARTPADDD